MTAEVDAGAPPGPIDDPLIRPVTLRTLDEQGEPEYWEVTLEEVIANAMANSQVLRDLGGRFSRRRKRWPRSSTARCSRPIRGSAWKRRSSAFDAQLNSLATFQHNHRVYNNRFLGGGANFFRQDKHDYITELSKYGATALSSPCAT